MLNKLQAVHMMEALTVTIELPEVMEIRDLLHTEPAELSPTDSTGHVITGTIIHLNN